MSTDHHIRGLILGAIATIEGWGGWFLAHIQVINGVMEFSVYAVALVTGIIGLRKVLRKLR